MRDSLRIDGQKLDLHPRRVAAWLDAKDDWEKAKKVYPIYVEISPIGVCNHECTFCSVDYMLDRTDAPRIPYDVMERTLTEMAEKGVLSLLFAGAGEPLLYRDRATRKTLGDVILHADKVGLDTEITSNTVLMDEWFCEKAFSAPHFRRVRTSLNGGDAETYQKIHRAKPGDFEKVLRNLEQAVKIRDRLGSKALLTVQMVVVPSAEGRSRKSLLLEQYPSNLHTVIPLTKMLCDIGVDGVSFKPYKQHTVELGLTRSKMYQRADYRERDIFAEAEALGRPGFEVVARYAAMNQQATEDRGYKMCGSTPFFWGYIEADCIFWSCSAHVGRMEGDKEIGDHIFRLGDVSKQSFSEIWEGERRKACWEYTRKPASEGGLNLNNCMKGCQMDMPNIYLDKLRNPGPLDNYIK